MHIEISLKGIAPLENKLQMLGLFDGHVLLETMLRTVQSQTRKRIAQTKTGPDGQKWPVRQEDGKPALFQTGNHLFDSIDYKMSYPTGKVSTGWIGAKIHQFGGEIKPVNGKALHFTIGGKDVFAQKVTIPARPYMGLNGADIAELNEIATEMLGALL